MLDELIGQFANDYRAAVHAPTAIIGYKLRLYRTLADAGPLAPEQLADRTDGDQLADNLG